MGIEHVYGQQLVELTKGHLPHGVSQAGNTPNQKMQRAALNLAAVLDSGHDSLMKAAAEAESFFEMQLKYGHMALKPNNKGRPNELLVQGNHAPIWFGAAGAMVWLAAMDPRLSGLSKLAKQWWLFHLCLSYLVASPDGHVVTPGARANEAGGPTSFHRDSILRECLGLPQLFNARKPTFWDGHSPDLVGPYYVRNLRTFFPTPEEIRNPANLPKLPYQLKVVRYTGAGHTAEFIPAPGQSLALGSTRSAWMDYETGETGFDVPAPAIEGMAVIRYAEAA